MDLAAEKCACRGSFLDKFLQPAILVVLSKGSSHGFQMIADLEKSGRKVMLVVVPEHGAAEKGDKVQVAHLRDIPSPAITHVPALVKFIGVTPADSPVTVDTKTSYLAVSSLIGRVLETNYFGKPEGEVPLKDLLKDLPQTHSVSENANAKVVNYKGKDYVKMDNKDWREYAN